jgi:hypothetical protein
VVDGLHILIRNRTMKLLAITLSRMKKRSRGRDGGHNLTNVQYKSIQNCHNNPPIQQIYPKKIFHAPGLAESMLYK